MAVKKATVKKAPAKKPVVKKGSEKELKDLEKKIGKVPKFFRELTTKEPEMFNLVMRFEQHIWDDGKLSRKTKKLIAIAIAAACATSMQSMPSLRVRESRGHQGRSKEALRLHSCSQVCPHILWQSPARGGHA